ncbi:hypothetical protein ACMFMG_008727 [Clarireedia jacksonii]
MQMQMQMQTPNTISQPVVLRTTLAIRRYYTKSTVGVLPASQVKYKTAAIYIALNTLDRQTQDPRSMPRDLNLTATVPSRVSLFEAGAQRLSHIVYRPLLHSTFHQHI